MQCPRCKSKLKANATRCKACGYSLPASSGGTLDPTKFLEPEDSTSGSPEASRPSDPEKPQAKAVQPKVDPPKTATPKAGQPGTPSAEDASDKGERNSDLEGTLQLPDSPNELVLSGAEESDSNDRNQTVDVPSDESLDTMDFDSIMEEESSDSDVRGTILYSDEEPSPAGKSDATVDFVSHEATLQDNVPSSSSKHGTMEYDSQELAEAAGRSTDSGGSGSAGRLNRIWGGAGGSGSNPMLTLKGGGALASDSIFERVAHRVLTAQSAQTIIEKDVKRVGDRDSVKQCIEIACQSAPTALADYQINGFLGKGGMGVVMQARQSAIGRDVALKMILPSASGSKTVSSTRDQQKKFLYEAQITGKLDHPNIVPVYDLGVSNGVLFYSMKKIVGTEWTHRMPEFSQEENLDVWLKVADAMAFSHQRDIIHRDLKPDNVMLGPFGEVLVTDWGCAVDISLKEKFTGAGSPPWMAPEMANHRQEKIGACSDIYLMGAILYQIIQGYPPHPGRTAMEVLRNAANNLIIPVKEPDPLMKIALRAMEHDPADRYSSLEEMQEAIRQYRRHSESIALTQRSEATLDQAIATKDYERFSRSIFGFQDALELWPENNIAASSLCKARYAYGECAYARKDYDLCLATLNRSQPDENALYIRAEKGKQIAQQRESRLKTMWKALAAVIILGMAGTSIAAGVAMVQRNEAVSQRSAAEEARDLEEKARLDAEASEERALAAADAEKKAKEDEVIARQNAEAAEKKALAAAEAEKKAKEDEVIARQNAEAAEKKALAAADEERKAKEETQRRTGQVELAGLKSNVSLAISQIEQLDVDRASRLLRDLTLPETHTALAASNQLPKVENWAWKRINLLTNSDLLQDSWGQQVTALAYSSDASVGAVATLNGDQSRLQMLRLDKNRMVVDPQKSVEPTGIVESILISPDGSQVVYSIRSQGNQNSVFRWRPGAGQPTPIESAQNRWIQGFVATEDSVVGGLNKGLWVWKYSEESDQEPTQITDIQGRMMSIQLVDEKRVLVLAEMVGGQRHPHFISLDQPEEADQREFLRVQDALRSDRLSAVAYSKGRLILGTESGQLFSTQYIPGTNLSPAETGVTRDFGVDVTADSLVELPNRHTSAIKSIVVHEDGSLLTIADEPLVHLWKPDNTPSGFRHDQRLTGTTRNVQRAAFVSTSDHVLAVAEDGRSIVWDAVRQKQRNQVQYSAADGRPNDSPAVAIVPCEDNLHAISILEDGRIDRWNTQTGQSVHQSDVPLAYVGHDPKAQFVDMAIDEEAGILITSANLGRISLSQVPGTPDDPKEANAGDLNWEFVKWDLSSGRMVDRWTRRASEEQAISLSNAGRYVLYGSDMKTQLSRPASQSGEEFLRDFGSYFGYVHPKATNLMLLVKLNGVARLVDTDRLEETWQKPEYQLSQSDFNRVATKGDRTILGRWAPDGNAFYLVWDSGRVTELLWSGDQLRIGRDLSRPDQRLDLSLPTASVSGSNGAPTVSGIRIGSRWNIDMKVRSQNGHNLVYAAVRFPGNAGLTRLTRIVFPAGNEMTSRQTSESSLGRRFFVLSDDETPRLEVASLETLRDRLSELSQKIAGTRTIGGQTYVATRQGNVYRVSDHQVQVFGRPKLLSGTGDRSGNIVITLHEGGILWRADWQKDGWQWKQLDMAPPEARHVCLSPNGQELLIGLENGARLVSAESGQPLDRLLESSSMTAYAWQPNADATLAAVLSDGEVKIFEGANSRMVGSMGSRVAQSVHFFNETWNDPNKPVTEWLAIHCRSGDQLSGDEILYLSLNDEQPKEQSLVLTSRPTVIECSPQDGLLVIGGQGTVSVYFASPSLEDTGKELFSLSGHSGANVLSLRFSHDGKTLVSTDSLNRVFGWLSQDALEGVTDKVALALAHLADVKPASVNPAKLVPDVLRQLPVRTRYVDPEQATITGE